MSNPALMVFGESKGNKPDSIYTYANTLTFDIMEKLADDKRFLACNQADILNLSLIILYGFISHDEHDHVSKAKLHEFIEDFKEFKDFAMFTMNVCRQNNVAYNDTIKELIKKETAQ